jgi:hypothetical protein
VETPEFVRQVDDTRDGMAEQYPTEEFISTQQTICFLTSSMDRAVAISEVDEK